MREQSVARNYAQALLELAQKAKDPAGWGTMINDVSAAVRREPTLRRFLESPRVSADEKNTVLAKAFQDRLPRLLVRFLQLLVANRRQMLIPDIAREYMALLDEVEGRVHAEVTVANLMSASDEKALTGQISRAVGKTVEPHFTVDPSILGGIVVRYGDTLMDGSVRRRLARLRLALSSRT
jgi:F-type H+-transporting ATPase subunit delta